MNSGDDTALVRILEDLADATTTEERERLLAEALQLLSPWMESTARQLWNEHTLRPHLDEEDLVQVTKIRLHERLRRGGKNFRSVKHFRNYVRRALKNSLRDLARRSDATKRGGDVGFTKLTPDIADSAESAEEQEMTREALASLDVVLSALPENERQLLTWKFTDGLTFREIAVELGEPVSSVYRQFTEIVERLEDELNDHRF